MALADARKNFAWSTVATAPSPATSGTSLVVASGEGARFPAASFNAVIAPSGVTPSSANAEIVRVTGVSTDTLTITRAVESTSARTVIVGDRIYTSITAVDYPPPGLVGGITTIQPDDAAAAGTAETYARGDHKHAIVAAAAGAITGSAAEGSSTSFARADHDHSLTDAFVTSRLLKPTFGVVAASGSVTITATSSGTAQDITGATATFSPATASTAIILGVWDIQQLGTTSTSALTTVGQLDIDGSAQTGTAIVTFNAVGASGAPQSRVCSSQIWTVNLTAASHTIKLQAYKTAAGTGTSTVLTTNTKLFYLVVSQ